jgi:hypothetical protein
MTNDLADLTTRPSGNPVLDRLDDVVSGADAAEKLDAIIRRTDAEEVLQSLQAPTFYRLMKRAGWDQSYDLLQYATPAQIQTFIDFDCWKRDRILTDDLEKWLGALVSESDDAHFKRVCRELDPEILAIFFKSHLHVEMTDDQQRPPDHLEGEVEVTPDGSYAIVYPDDEDKATLLRMLLDRLYHVDRVLAWTLLEAVRWELMSQMEETAYRWRNKRIEEYGFVSRDEAVEIYQYVEPVDYRERIESEGSDVEADVDPPQRLGLPEVFQQEFDEEFFLFRAVRPILDEEKLKRVLFEIRAVLNRAIVADGVEPGEIEAAGEVVRRTLGYASLGLQFLSRDDVERARDYVLEVPIKQIFRVGYSLTSKLQHKIESLRDRPTLSLLERDELSLLNEDDRALADSLLRHRPTYAADRHDYDIFKEQDQLDDAAFRVGLIAFKQVWLFGLGERSVSDVGDLVFGDETLNSPETVSFDSLFTTRIVRHLTSPHGDDLAPIDSETLEELPDLVRDAPWEGDVPGYFEELLEPIREASSAADKLALQWLNETLDHLEDEFGRVSEIENPEIFESVLLLAET